MLLKKIIGIAIIVLNIGGLGFILYRLGLMLKDKYLIKKQPPPPSQQAPADIKQETKNINGNIVPDEDDLLKDMDLSDLDDLDLDDFK